MSELPATKKHKTAKVCLFVHLVIQTELHLLADCFQLIGTHNGIFHCDEALAVFLLRQTDAYRDAGTHIIFLRIVRMLIFFK